MVKSLRVNQTLSITLQISTKPYLADHRYQISLDPSGVNKILEDDQHKLLEPFSLEEIKEAVFGMEPNKSVGPDGFNAEFYKKPGMLLKVI